MVDLRRPHHEPVPGQSVRGSAYGPRQLEDLRVQHDAGISRARLRWLRRREVHSARKALYGQFDVSGGDLHLSSPAEVGSAPVQSRIQRLILKDSQIFLRRSNLTVAG